MLKKYSIKKQFILTFAMVIISSIVAMIITTTLLLILVSTKQFKEANYYEKMLPEIENYINTENVKLLSRDREEELNKIMPKEGITYRVINLNNNSSYGTIEWNDSRNDKLLYELNKTNVDVKNNVEKFIPLINEKGELEGVIVLKYFLKISSEGMPKLLASFILLLISLSPFIFIILFSYLYGIKLAKNINDPLNKLKMASKKIEVQDLEFNLEYPYNNELGEVIVSFNNMKEALKETLDKQWFMEEERKEIIGGLSHDLRSPLTIIKGKIDLLLEGAYKNEERLILYLKSIDNSTTRAINLVEDLNTINKLENPEFKIELTNNNIEEFLEEKLENIRVLAYNKSIDIDLNKYNIDKNSYYSFDKDAISRVIDNIVVNAIRHTENNGKIEITIEKHDNEIYFRIDDNGRGFTERDLGLALNKFYRGDKSRNSNSGNSGLGLYISRIIIEKHGGEIKLSNNKMKGARIEFSIRLLN